jgi:hypothetical protein
MMRTFMTRMGLGTRTHLLQRTCHLAAASLLLVAGCKMSMSGTSGSDGPRPAGQSADDDEAGSVGVGMGGGDVDAEEVWAGAGGECSGELDPTFVDLHEMGDPDVGPHRELIAHVGDLDGDQDIDVVTYSDSGDSGGDVAGWHENKGDGTFTFNRISQGGNTNTDIWVADLDGDGDQDILHATDDFGGQQPGGLAIYENAGKARSWKRHWVVKGEDVDRVWAADIDGDQAMDIVIERDEKLSWLANEARNGRKWSKPRSFGDLPGVSLLAAHDIDRDGDDDFIHYVADRELGWLENDNGKSWNPTTLGTDLSHRYATMGQSIEPVDFDGDGDIDIIAGNGSWVGGVHVFINADGKGTFAQSKLLERSNYNQAGSVIATDVDGDQRIDLLVGSEHADGVHTFSYDPKTKSCGKASAFPNRLERIIHLRAGDLDGDGDQDLIVARAVTGLVWLENSTK